MYIYIFNIEGMNYNINRILTRKTGFGYQILLLNQPFDEESEEES